MENERFIFSAEDIFEDIPGDTENVRMKFPDEVLKLMGWKEGDVLDIDIKDGQIVVKKHG